MQPNPPLNGCPYPRALCRGHIDFGAVNAGCFIVADGNKRLRVFSKRDALHVLTGNRHSGNLQRYEDAIKNSEKINGTKAVENPANSSENDEENPENSMGPTIEFSLPNGRKVHGVEAATFVALCQRYVNAMMNGTLHPKQAPIATRAWRVVAASSVIGIEMLVDNATGYELLRPRDEMRKKFALLMRDEFADWERMFPEELYQEFARLENYTYTPGVRPMHWGKITMEIYRCFDAELAEELQRRNPNPSRGRNHHQLLTKLARNTLERRLESIVVTAKQAHSMPDFLARLAFLFRGRPLQLWLPPAA